MEINMDLVVSKATTGKRTEYVIKKYRDGATSETKLSEVFDGIPPGLVHKDETGMGATYMELLAKRNSIIIEPIKITASSKAHHHNAFYVGSETRFHPELVKREDIKAYANNSNIEYKKIIVVADSISKVFVAIGDRMFTDYFLLIDEIDSFQMDASFRGSMERVIDFYKKFSPDKRSMVSATVIDFSDPELAKEPVTHIRYDKPTIRNITLFNTENINGAVAEKIKELSETYPDKKIMVAFNSVSACVSIAMFLVKNKVFDSNDVKLLCSANSKEVAGEFYAELDSTSLPATLNFVTSAYFTGFDLLEQYHLVSVSSNRTYVCSLSDKRLKQIAGRCRTGLLSETVIYDVVSTQKGRTLAEVLREANIEISALNCIRKNYITDETLKQSFDHIRNLVIENTQRHPHKFVRVKDGEAIISYLSIDSYLESTRVVRELYHNTGILADVLRQAGHSIVEKAITSEKKIKAQRLDMKQRIKEVIEIVEKIADLKGDDPVRLVNSRSITSFQRNFVSNFYYLYRYIDNAQLLKLMAEEAVRRDRRAFNGLMLSAFFLAMHPDEPYKRVVNFHIPIDQTFTPEQLLQKWQDIFTEMNMLKTIKKERNAVHLTKLHFKTTKRRSNDDERKTLGHYIKAENPLELTRISYKPVVNNQNTLDYAFKSLFQI